ncbi:MAG: hypothetical protein AAGJ52_13185 [Pseudomonadota bacterium]
MTNKALEALIIRALAEPDRLAAIADTVVNNLTRIASGDRAPDAIQAQQQASALF